VNKIATILPYKENYSTTNAGAASLWVCDFLRYSKYKKNNIIFGSTIYKKYLTNNYININLSNYTSKFSSTTSEYCIKLSKELNKKKFEIIEIHNRPQVFFLLKKKVKAKYILYFHNDPLSMKGSKSINDRNRLFNDVDKIIFVSRWVQERFFTGLDKSLTSKTDIVYPSIHKEKRIYKKDKKIVFVGKLNKSKGYDIYKEAIIKILNEFQNWQAFSIGDEKRDKPLISHPNHVELGYLRHNVVLKFLAKSEIAVVPSRWEEPFGRTALESSSRACATIISNRGGLPETTDHRISLDVLNATTLYKAIKKLITNKKIRTNLQINGFKNVKHITKDNSHFIDKIRKKLMNNFQLNFNNSKIRILNVYNLGQKINHRLYNISLGKKFTNGFIRNNYDVLEISDRDFIKQNRGFSIGNTYYKFQKYLRETFKNYNPNLIIFGHSNNIAVDTFNEFKNINKNLVISHWNEDPIMPGLEDTKNNIKKISSFKDIVDHTFITTDPTIFKKQNNELDKLHYIFIPVDKNIECYDVYKLNPDNDIFYAMSHGVNRASLKKGKSDSRSFFLDSLINYLDDNINYDFYGYKNKQPIWGDNFYKALINSKMGLNLSRGAPTKLYSSNRIASIMGNGLLTFIDKKTQFDKIFNKDEVVLYNNVRDLSEKINYYKKNNSALIKIARNGQKKYFNLFNEKKISKYIVDKSFGKSTSLF
jgi:glycosyltransferase involved in cell wall biosynthesis